MENYVQLHEEAVIFHAQFLNLSMCHSWTWKIAVQICLFSDTTFLSHLSFLMIMQIMKQTDAYQKQSLALEN